MPRIRLPHGTPKGVIVAVVAVLICLKLASIALVIWFVVWVLRVAGVGI